MEECEVAAVEHGAGGRPRGRVVEHDALFAVAASAPRAPLVPLVGREDRLAGQQVVQEHDRKRRGGIPPRAAGLTRAPLVDDGALALSEHRLGRRERWRRRGRRTRGRTWRTWRRARWRVIHKTRAAVEAVVAERALCKLGARATVGACAVRGRVRLGARACVRAPDHHSRRGGWGRGACAACCATVGSCDGVGCTLARVHHEIATGQDCATRRGRAAVQAVGAKVVIGPPERRRSPRRRQQRSRRRRRPRRTRRRRR